MVSFVAKCLVLFSAFFLMGMGYPVEKLKVPPHFKISLWALVPGARSITQSPDGSIFVGTNKLSHVYRIRDWNKDGVITPDEIEIFIDKLQSPNGVAFRDGSLYVAEVPRILVFDGVTEIPKGKTLTSTVGRELPYKFPTDTHHGWKFIRFAPPPLDNWLYVPVGAPCNICKVSPEHGVIHRIDVEGQKRVSVAFGMRNTVGFDFHPKTKNLWFTDNGRDWLGDNLPPDELNELTKEGQHFGFPYCHGKGIVDSDIKFDSVIKSCKQTVFPKLELGPHHAALGMRFYKGTQFPKAYHGQIILAEHGSWNRSKKGGYRIMTARTGPNNQLIYEPLVTGWLDDATQKAWGRPVDVEQLRDGSLLISDDGGSDEFSGAIYRLEYKP